MRRAITFFPIVTLATVFALSASPARANEWNQLSYFTFNAPVELPGVALRAGTYMFKRPDLNGDRQMVQVFSEDGQTLYGTFLTIPEARTESKLDARVSFEKGPTRAPAAIRDWFYPGRVIGDEFVYGDAQATKLEGAR